jgi:hypothetical protein
MGLLQVKIKEFNFFIKTEKIELIFESMKDGEKVTMVQLGSGEKIVFPDKIENLVKTLFPEYYQTQEGNRTRN